MSLPSAPGLTFQPSGTHQSGGRCRALHHTAKVNWLVGDVPDDIPLTAAAQGNVVYAQEFARRYGNKIISVSVHPGSVLALICVIHVLADTRVQQVPSAATSREIILTRTVCSRHFHVISDASSPHKDPIFRFFLKLLAYPTPMGVLTSLYAGTSPELEHVRLNGGYLTPWARVGTPRSNDPVLGTELWTWLEEQVEGREYLNKIRVEMIVYKRSNHS